MKKNDEPKKNKKTTKKMNPKKKMKKTKTKTYFKILSHFVAYNSKKLALYAYFCSPYYFASLF